MPSGPVRIAVITVSDTRTLDNDTSGAVLAERLQGAGHILAGRAVAKDDVGQIREAVLRIIERGEADVVPDDGRHRPTGRDVTPRRSSR
ncbi:MAG: molybdopterin-binding protein [Hyphomonadaceae bacterium]